MDQEKDLYSFLKKQEFPMTRVKRYGNKYFPNAEKENLVAMVPQKIFDTDDESEQEEDVAQDDSKVADAGDSRIVILESEEKDSMETDSSGTQEDLQLPPNTTFNRVLEGAVVEIEQEQKSSEEVESKENFPFLRVWHE